MVALLLSVSVAAALHPVVATLWLSAELTFCLWWTTTRLPSLNKGSASTSLQQHSSEEAGNLVEEGHDLLKRLLSPDEGARPLLQNNAHTWFNSWFLPVAAAGDSHNRLAPQPAGSSSTTAFQLGLQDLSQLVDGLLLRGKAWAVMSDVEAQRHVTQLTTQLATSLQLGIENAVGSSTSGQGSEVLVPLATAQQMPLITAYRPLLFYMLTEAAAAFSHIVLTLSLGFTKVSTSSHATFYVRPGSGAAASAPPLVFLHGIGLGLAPYLGFLSRMAAAADASPEGGRRTLVAVQYRHVSMRLSRRIPTAVEVARDVEAFLLKAGITEACVTAHSYGTLVASALLKRVNAAAAAGARTVSLAGLTLLDPVAFCMFLPHTLRAAIFFDHSSSTATAGKPGLQATSAAPSSPAPASPTSNHKSRSLRSYLSPRALLKGIVVRDAHCAAALMRGGHWSEVNLWPSELPHNTSVILSGSDHLVPVEAIVTQLQSASSAAAKGVTVQVHEGRGHGAFVLDPAMQANILSLASIGFKNNKATETATSPPAQSAPAAPTWASFAAATVLAGAATNEGQLSITNLLSVPSQMAAVKAQYLAVAIGILAGAQTSVDQAAGTDAAPYPQPTFPWLLSIMPQPIFLALLLAINSTGSGAEAATVTPSYQDAVSASGNLYMGRSSFSTPRTQHLHIQPLSSVCPGPCTPRGAVRGTHPSHATSRPRFWVSKTYTSCKPFHISLA